MSEKIIPGTKVTGDQTGKSTPEQTFTKEQVNQLMRKRVERSHQSFFNRYGVKDLAELDDLVGKSRSYDATLQLNGELEQKYNDLNDQHIDLTKKYAYRVGNVNPDKYNDIETYFKGKNLPINEENLINELKSHQDWVKKPSTILNIGAETAPVKEVDELTEASKYFGVDLSK